LPGAKKKPKRAQKKKSFRERFSHYIKWWLILFFLFIYLIYTNQSSTLWYGLRKSLRDLERTQEQYDTIQLLVSQKEQQLRSQVEWKSSKEKIKKMYVD
jgi:hypothetical protein